MRPAASFTLHAIFAACLAALAASSAAAEGRRVIDNESKGFFQMRLGGTAGDVSEGFAITGYRFGPTRAARSWAKVDGLGVSWDVPDAQAGYYSPANTKYSNVKLGRSDGAAASGRVTGLATDPPEPASGLPTGKRMHKPVVLTRPLDRGSVALRGSFAGCEVGKRYAGAQFAGGGMMYQLEDVVVADCGQGGAILNYAKVKVRGWDPEKKEQ